MRGALGRGAGLSPSESCFLRRGPACGCHLRPSPPLPPLPSPAPRFFTPRPMLVKLVFPFKALFLPSVANSPSSRRPTSQSRRLLHDVRGSVRCRSLPRSLWASPAGPSTRRLSARTPCLPLYSAAGLPLIVNRSKPEPPCSEGRRRRQNELSGFPTPVCS